MSDRKTRRQRLTETVVSEELQKDAENEMGKMGDVRTETSLEFFVKFYRFYLRQMPWKPESYKDQVKGAMCINLCTRILERATSIHDISQQGFVAMTKL